MSNKSLAPRMAWRYLFSKKQHGAVGVITAVSMCGVAVATAAIICVLSVFNGFQSILADKQSILGSDAVVTPASGKTFENADSLLQRVLTVEGVAYAYPTITDNALAYFSGHEMPVTLKGVPQDTYAKATAIKSVVMSDGEYLLVSDTPISATHAEDEGTDPSVASSDPLHGDEELSEEEILMEELKADENAEKHYYSLLSPGVAIRLGVRPYARYAGKSAGDGFILFAPRRLGQVNMANPGASFMREEIPVTGVFQTMQSDYDKDFVIVDINVARRLLQYDPSQASSIEVAAKKGVDPSALGDRIRRVMPDNVVVKDKLQQQEINFRMISIEKWITFLLLAFILVVASFNIISSLSMLVLDKEGNLATLSAMGASSRSIGRIFWWESIFVTIIGAAIGILLGVALCLAQQHFGLIKLNGDPTALVIHAYPVVVIPKDILIVCVPIFIIGFATAAISSRFAKSRINSI